MILRESALLWRLKRRRWSDLGPGPPVLNLAFNSFAVVVGVLEASEVART